MNPEPGTHDQQARKVLQGRPTKRTPEVVAKIAAAIATGLTDEEAGLLAGINADTIDRVAQNRSFPGR